MKFYLSGGMEFKEGLGAAWREWVTEKLETLGHSTLDPTKLEEDGNIQGPLQYQLSNWKLQGELDKVREVVRSTLFRKDMYGIQMSDALIVLYDKSVQKGAGTLAETWEAFREGRPIYLVSKFDLGDIPTWLIGETLVMFSNFEDFLEHITKPGQILEDIEKAKKIRDEVLGGVYTT